MSNYSPAEESPHVDVDRSHLEDIDTGAGCTEVWEELSKRRAEAKAATDDD